MVDQIIGHKFELISAISRRWSELIYSNQETLCLCTSMYIMARVYDILDIQIYQDLYTYLCETINI